MMADLSLEITGARRKCHAIFQVLKELSTQNPISSEISFRNEQEIKTFSDKGKLREFVTSRHTLKEWLKEVL